jgi:hypothetical protein
MKKELKYYLPLYGIGCPVKTIDGLGTVLVIHPKAVTVSLNKISLDQTLHGVEKGNGGLHRTYLYKDSFFTLILRPLSDMTDEERAEAFTIKGKNAFVEFEAETTKFLLSKHFDLFGLIEAGLAIDKTTLM